MKRHFEILIATVVAAVLSGCATRNNDSMQSADWPKFSHPREITNPYLPLASLKQDILENKKERVERTAKPDVQKVFQVGSQSVAALAIEDREFDSKGNLKEITLDYFAQDDGGNVYYLGEDVDEYSGGKISGHGGAWLFGKNTQTLGVLMPAHPKIGDRFRSEDVPHITWEADEVVSISETASVPAGTFANCVRIQERASDGVTEYKLYATGIGNVVDDDLPLVKHEVTAE